MYGGRLKFKEIFRNQAQLHRAAAARAEAVADDPRIHYPQVVGNAARRHERAAISIAAAVVADENKLEAAQKVALKDDTDALSAMQEINSYGPAFKTLANNHALSAMRRINPNTAFANLPNQAAGRRKKTKNHRKKTHKTKSRKSHRRKSKKQRKTKRRQGL